MVSPMPSDGAFGNSASTVPVNDEDGVEQGGEKEEEEGCYGIEEVCAT